MTEVVNSTNFRLLIRYVPNIYRILHQTTATYICTSTKRIRLTKKIRTLKKMMSHMLKSCELLLHSITCEDGEAIFSLVIIY